MADPQAALSGLSQFGSITPKLTARDMVDLVQARIITHEVALAYLQKHYGVPTPPVSVNTKSVSERKLIVDELALDLKDAVRGYDHASNRLDKARKALDLVFRESK